MVLPADGRRGRHLRARLGPERTVGWGPYKPHFPQRGTVFALIRCSACASSLRVQRLLGVNAE